MDIDETAMRPMTDEENERMSGKPNNVNHPKHYNRENSMECIDEMELIFGVEATMHFCLLNDWKYRYRAGDKNGQEDIKKSDWYIKKYKELKSKNNNTMATAKITYPIYQTHTWEPCEDKPDGNWWRYQPTSGGIQIDPNPIPLTKLEPYRHVESN